MALPGPGRTLRVIGFDDVPWRHRQSRAVGLVGAVCAGTRFEGMVYGAVRRDGWNATEEIVRLLARGKHLRGTPLDPFGRTGERKANVPRWRFLAKIIRRQTGLASAIISTSLTLPKPMCLAWSTCRKASPSR